MPTALPVPIRFELPDGWFACGADTASEQGVAFAARRRVADARFTPTITIDGDSVDAGTGLQRLADESIERLAQVFDSVSLLERRDTGTAEMPVTVQSLAVAALVDGVVVDLVQDQVYVLFSDDRSRSAAIVRTVLTAHRDQHRDVAAEFQAFLRTVELDQD